MNDWDAAAADDPWAPVQVPYYAPVAASPRPLWYASEAAAAAAEAAEATARGGGTAAAAGEEDDLFYFQLPTALPPLARDRLRRDRPGGVCRLLPARPARPPCRPCTGLLPSGEPEHLPVTLPPSSLSQV